MSEIRYQEEKIIKSDEKLLEDYRQKDYLMRKNINSYSNSVINLLLFAAIFPTLSIFIITLISSSLGFIFTGIFSVIGLICFILLLVKIKQSREKEELSEDLSSLIEEMLKAKMAKDLMNYYKAKFFQNKWNYDMIEREEFEIVLQDGNIVDAIIKYDNDGKMSVKVQSKIEYLTPSNYEENNPHNDKNFDIIESLRE